MLRASGVTDTGRVRSANEDCFAIREDLGLCVIADGMGGHNAGEVASRLAVDTLIACFEDAAANPKGVPAEPATVHPGVEPETPTSDHRWPFGYDTALSETGNLLRTAIHLANLRILDTASGDDAYTGMGTTIVAACIVGGRLSAAHVGDSRLYLFTGGALRPLTRDDSWIASMLALDPSADPSLLLNHPMRSALTSVVGDKSLNDVHVHEQPMRGGELLLMTTDGVHGVLDDAFIEQLMQDGGELPATAAKLVLAALDGGSRDNCTAIVARYEQT